MMEQHHINKKSVERALHELEQVPSATLESSKSGAPLSSKKKKKKKSRNREEEDAVPPKTILFDDGWEFIQNQGLEKLKSLVQERYQTGANRGEEEDDVIFPREEAVEICTKIFVMCHQFDPYNHSQALYDRHGQTVKDYLKYRLVDEMEQAVSSPTPEETLTCWLDLTDEFQFFTKWWNNFFRILDRVHAEPRHLPSVNTATWTYFQHKMFQPYQEMISQAVLYLIQNDREGQAIDMSLVTETIRIFKVLDDALQTTYLQDLEEEVLETTREYYDSKRVEWNYFDVNTYFKKAFEAIEEENMRVKDYLHQVLVSPVPEVEAASEASTGDNALPDQNAPSFKTESTEGTSGEINSDKDNATAEDKPTNRIQQILQQELLDKAPIPVSEWNKRTEEPEHESGCNQFVPVVGIFARGRSVSRNRKSNRERSRSNSRGLVAGLLARGRSLSRTRKDTADNGAPSNRPRGRSSTRISSHDPTHKTPPLTRENNKHRHDQDGHATPSRRRFSFGRKKNDQ